MTKLIHHFNTFVNKRTCTCTQIPSSPSFSMKLNEKEILSYTNKLNVQKNGTVVLTDCFLL